MKACMLIVIVCLFGDTGVTGCALEYDPHHDFWGSSSSSSSSSSSQRWKREVTLEERVLCGEDDEQPATRVNTSLRVQNLRLEMEARQLDAYLIPTDDDHQSEYVGLADKRRQYITGFEGSAGTAVVLLNGEQALWTDGRYFLQADDELDCDWILMKEKKEGVPTILEWLKEKLSSGSKVGADPRVIGAESWIEHSKDLAEAEIELVPEEMNLVDVVWPDSERPPYVQDQIIIHELEFAGKKWEDKADEVRAKLEELNADVLVVTALDEVAWLLNLRGNDIPFNPVFRSYVILTKEHVYLFLPPNKITPAVDNHLHVNQCDQPCVIIESYNDVLNRLKALSASESVRKVLVGKKHSYSGGASFAVYSAIPEEKRLLAVSPVLEMKSQKNEVEIEGMKNSHIRDAVALVSFLSFMEEEMKTGGTWDEITASEKLLEYRQEQDHFMGLSFETISAFGPNGAVIHYRPKPETKRQITTNSLYLLDSGGQYKDGTTDVTRTMHYGEPTPYQIDAYTRVLMGAIDLAMLVFPEGTTDAKVDILARRPLFAAGLDYRHGTGHGIGMFLNVHESFSPNYLLNLHISNEPGFYADGEFGIRLETILHVVEKETPYHFHKRSLGFEPVTIVPFESKLINATLLSDHQCAWLNNYHRTCREVLGEILAVQDKTHALDWLFRKTELIECGPQEEYHPEPTNAAVTLEQPVEKETLVFSSNPNKSAGNKMSGSLVVVFMLGVLVRAWQ
ncbi:xaa-Pro aminopeptidase 1-like isoform X2 [Oratosquilla oratoria]|uniref:xaa-Pro aminopeptidase 1-like isoform X2 n=1 Tax=Oratosquilla oratoria TaxID=337810 RepID=UPI003F75C65D